MRYGTNWRAYARHRIAARLQQSDEPVLIPAAAASDVVTHNTGPHIECRTSPLDISRPGHFPPNPNHKPNPNYSNPYPNTNPTNPNPNPTDPTLTVLTPLLTLTLTASRVGENVQGGIVQGGDVRSLHIIRRGSQGALRLRTLNLRIRRPTAV